MEQLDSLIEELRFTKSVLSIFDGAKQTTSEQLNDLKKVKALYKTRIENLEKGIMKKRGYNIKEGDKIVQKDKVFVIYGRNEIAYTELASFLLSLGLEVIEWEHAVRIADNPSPYIGDVIDSAFNCASAILVLLTPDEDVVLKQELRKDDDNTMPLGQARANVIFEAGAAWAKHPSKTIIVQMGKQNIWSDIDGKHLVRISNALRDRKRLINRLQTVGCNLVDITASSFWEKQGNLELIQM